MGHLVMTVYVFGSDVLRLLSGDTSYLYRTWYLRRHNNLRLNKFEVCYRKNQFVVLKIVLR